MIEKLDKRILAAILVAVIAGVGVYWYWSSTVKKPLTLRYGYVPFADCAPIFVAVEMGFFEDENLNVSLTSFLSDVTIIEAAVAGSLDGGIVITSTGLSAFEGGINLKFAGCGTYYDKEHDPSVIVVRANSTIRSIEDLKGKTIAVSTVGAQGLLYWHALLRNHGLTPEDVEFTVIKSASDKLEAIIAGRVDAGVIGEPYLTPALETGKVRILSGIFTEVFPDHTYQMSTTFFMKSFIDEHKDAVDAFIRAYDKAVDWIDDHPTETREIIAEWTGMDPELCKKMLLQNYLTQLDQEGVERIIDLMLEYGLLEQDIALEDIVYQG